MTAQTSIPQLGSPLRFYWQMGLPPRLGHFPALLRSRVVGKSVAIICGVFLLGAHLSAQAAVFAVTNTADSGAGSLRQAILDSNTSAGVLDTIMFNIPGAGVRSIIPLTVLPTITDPVIIDGYTQSGSSANTMAVGNNSVHLIELNGNGANFPCLTITAGSSTVRGLVINRFNGNGPANAINLLTNGGNKIEGCFIGVSADGTTAQSNNGLAIDIESSPNNTIGGATAAARNVISSNHGGSGSNILIGGPSSSGTTIQGNYIGTNAAGTADTGGNINGVQIGRGSGDGSSNNIIGGTTTAARNVISGNTGGAGIVLFDNTITGNKIQGNYIGTNAAGIAAVPNSTGVILDSTNNTTIGGTVAGAGNLISGNGYGIHIGGNGLSNNNLIQGNLIGTDATGMAAVGNNGGIILVGSNNTIGGTTPAARNIISGSVNGHGIVFRLFAATADNLIQGNYIGTDINGTAGLGNAADGIQIGEFETPTGSNTIGGTSAAARNIISANSAYGIELGGENILIQGNYIGTDVNGTADLGNGTNGIVIFSGSNNTIGGSAPGAGNTIAFNGKLAPGTNARNGVAVFSFATGTTIQGNSIFSSLRLGIDLSGGTENTFGGTANDDCDSDSGANNLQNYPVLTSVSSSGGMTSIAGTLNSAANTTYRIEFFANDAINPSGYGDGQSFIGSTMATTNANCNASFNLSVPQIAAGQRVTSTATDPAGNTSEFSAAIGQLLNISTRLKVLTGNDVLIGGFIVSGDSNKQVLLRALGPTLTQFGVTGVLADPTLDLRDGTGGPIASNDDWKDTQQAAINGTGLAPPNDLESAILHTFTPGNYTAIVRGKNNTTGVGLVEAYDIDKAPGTTLTNISTRGFVDTGNNVMIGGFISGNGIVKVIVRALGPTLSQFGVPNVLADPTLELHDGNGTTIASNDNWADTQQAEIQASGFAPPNAFESAIIISRPPGNTTAIVLGKSNTIGNALVEAYILPP